MCVGHSNSMKKKYDFFSFHLQMTFRFDEHHIFNIVYSFSVITMKLMVFYMKILKNIKVRPINWYFSDSYFRHNERKKKELIESILIRFHGIDRRKWYNAP